MIDEHLRRFFHGHAVQERTWPLGPMAARPDFRVLEFGPGPRSTLTTYVSLGAVGPRTRARGPFEFALCVERPTERAVELVTMVAWYHATEGLGVGHTFPIGEPWMPASKCTYFLVSLPYPFGPELELVDGHADNGRVLWLLPITPPERDYVAANGLEALEMLFDSTGLKYWAAGRPSVIQ